MIIDARLMSELSKSIININTHRCHIIIFDDIMDAIITEWIRFNDYRLSSISHLRSLTGDTLFMLVTGKV